jgi:uncharacterized protein
MDQYSMSDQENEKNAAFGAGQNRPCVICGKPMVETYKPFCSKRCADVDLNRWLSGSYVVPGEPVDLSQIDLNDVSDPRG